LHIVAAKRKIPERGGEMAVSQQEAEKAEKKLRPLYGE
jgi:hypothetical protein